MRNITFILIVMTSTASVFAQVALPSWDAKQMIGPPNTPNAGDITTAWASATPDGCKAWVELDFAKPVAPSRIEIYETYNPGAVYQVSAFIDGTETRLWKGKDPTSTQVAMGVSHIALKTKSPISKVRIYIDSPAVAGWNEIDAVSLIGKDGTKQWASDARASSNYSDHRLDVPFVDPFLTPEERAAKQITTMRLQVEQQKQFVRGLRAEIDSANAQIKLLQEEIDRVRKVIK